MWNTRAVGHDSAHSETLLTAVISMQMRPCRCVFWTLRRGPRRSVQSEVCLYMFTQNCVGTQQSVCKDLLQLVRSADTPPTLLCNSQIQCYHWGAGGI